MGGCCLGRHFEASRSDRRQSALAKSALAKGAWCSSKALSMPKGATGPLWANFWPGLTGTLGYFKTPRPGLGWIMCSICLLEPPQKMALNIPRTVLFIILTTVSSDVPGIVGGRCRSDSPPLHPWMSFLSSGSAVAWHRRQLGSYWISPPQRTDPTPPLSRGNNRATSLPPTEEDFFLGLQWLKNNPVPVFMGMRACVHEHVCEQGFLFFHLYFLHVFL